MKSFFLSIIMGTMLLAGVLFMPLGGVQAQEAEYGCGAYGTSAYQQNCPDELAGDSSDSGFLTDTGKKLPLLLALLILILGVAGLINSIRSRKKRKAAQNSSIKK